MRGTIVRIGATGAGALLALGLFAGPSAAEPRSDKQSKGEQAGKVDCFNPEGKTQGRSFSDPDGDSNGGADKPSPDCTGGKDKTDRDGNNGCGNDADREDDNNGNCGGDKAQGPGDVDAEQQDDDDKVKTEKVDADVKVQDAGSVSGADALAAEGSTTTVLGASLTAPAAADTTTSSTTPDTQVLGETLSAPDTLARTGAGVGGLALLGGVLLGGGRLAVLARRLLRIG